MSPLGTQTRIWEEVARKADFKPANMASLFSISERHLQRIFKNNLQCTPGRWLKQLRCRLAKELIVKGYSSKAAAAELKFATVSHFCREFKRVFGVSPQRFHFEPGQRPGSGAAVDGRKSCQLSQPQCSPPEPRGQAG